MRPRGKPDPQQRYFNREWSWLCFNERVLEEAEDEQNPLLERLRFLSIFAGNLDEFYMIRVAGLFRQVDAGIAVSGPDQRRPEEQLAGAAERVQALLPRLEAVLARLLHELADQGVPVLAVEQLDGQGRDFARRYYEELVYPVITPTIVGPKHPFPTLQNCTLTLVLRLAERRKPRGVRRRLAFLALPRVLPRFVTVRGANGTVALVPLESLLVAHAPSLFAGYEVQAISAVRVTRDADIAIDEDATEDMRRAVARKLLGRRHGAAVRLEHGSRIARKVLRVLKANLQVDPAHCYARRGLMQLVDVQQIYAAVSRADLKFPPLVPLPAARGRPKSCFEWLRRGAVLVHHPYHSFDPVAELVAEAANDPGVLAIKQTLYRTSGDSPVVRALTLAAERGKQVSVVVELRARFDEERNLEWARRLEHAGAHVVYGLVGYKTHCKALLVVRREPEGIRRYLHLGTGNYNDATARAYTDVGLLACDELLGEDVSALFNVITGATQPPAWNKIEMAPTGLRRRLLYLIGREAERSGRRARGRIIAKMNALVDPEVIDALYGASRAGVRVDLIVRGTCCLRPGVPGLSENVRVRSIVGRFLEHARVFWFANGGHDELYLSSADWMPRNLDHRIEILFPVEEPEHRRYLRAVLELGLQDNTKARELRADGVYRPWRAGRQRVDSQRATMELTEDWLGPREAQPLQRFVPMGRGTAREGGEG
ncbi:MAG: polyphosphate kinase 1 [Deltaproteobacteria bacterium]|nr:polyphosphate kinase 1 [Deltaproteobacteria bacterium]